MRYLLCLPFINACGGSGDDGDVQVGNIEIIQGYSNDLIASHEIIVKTHNLIRST